MSLLSNSELFEGAVCNYEVHLPAVFLRLYADLVNILLWARVNYIEGCNRIDGWSLELRKMH